MLRSLARTSCVSGRQRSFCRRTYTFVENDYVLLLPAIRAENKIIFVGPLKPGANIRTSRGRISHDEIINRSSRTLVGTIDRKHNAQYRLQQATLADYVRLTRRLVTPIYPADANLIISLFDFHPARSAVLSELGQQPDISILEAGTGHGSLTLFLSRAIHAANTPAPREIDFTSAEEYQTALRAWKATRSAVINTIEVSTTSSKHASSVVKGFRHGMYHDNVDFHNSNVSTYVKNTLAEQGNQPFLTHAFLDLPSVQNHVGLVAQALHTDGTLIVFTPSITQITEMILKIRQDGIPLYHERTVELGVNGGSGGREWDVKPVQPRAMLKAMRTTQADEVERGSELAVDTEDSDAADDQEITDQALTSEAAEAVKPDDAPWHMVCRPKVGDRITGGGFLAVLKKQRTD